MEGIKGVMNNNNRELNDNEYRKIKSLLFLYEVNASGSVVRNVKSKRKLSQRKTYRGYCIVDVCIKGKPRHLTVHSLVAECWLGEKPNGYEIDHIDRNKENNSWTNLRYVTHSENNLNRAMPWSKPVCIFKDGKWIRFKSEQDCAKYIASITGKAYGGIRNRLFNKRKFIHGYDIRYSGNAETGHGDHNW